jgi:hypothetical protein
VALVLLPPPQVPAAPQVHALAHQLHQLAG